MRKLFRKRIVLWAGALALAAGAVAGGPKDNPVGWSTNSFATETSSGKLGDAYALFIPKRYYATDKLWPLILFLHGNGERGASPEAMYSWGPAYETRIQGDFPGIVLSPICPAQSLWCNQQQRQTLNALLDHIIATCRVDTNRIYLTGLSLGGICTWDLCETYPDRFAAIVPVCGAGDLTRIERIRQVPVWAFQGVKDPISLFTNTENTVNTLRACGGKVLFTVYPEAAHDVWSQAYRRIDLYKWLFRQRRQAEPQPLEADPDCAAFIRDWPQRAALSAFHGSLVKTAACSKVTSPPALDGNLADPAWTSLAVLSGFRLPTGIAETEHPTAVRVGYDPNALYLAFTCTETNLAGLATNAVQRDDPNLWQDDCVEIFLDTKLSRKTYYHIIVTANAVIQSGIGRKDQWDAPGIRAAAGRTRNAWTVELKIPWADLGLQSPEPGARLGFELARYRAQPPDEVSQWSVTLRNNHVPSRFGVLCLQ
jgi:poly(3-hydroxybutyrate) depolymerase